MKKLSLFAALIAVLVAPHATAQEIDWYTVYNQFYCQVPTATQSETEFAQQMNNPPPPWNSYKIRYTDGTSSNCRPAIKPHKAVWTAPAEFIGCVSMNSTSGHYILHYAADGAEAGVYLKYEIQGSVVPGSWYSLANTNHQWYITVVANSPSTYFRVRGWNGKGWGEWSDTLAVFCNQCENQGGGFGQ